MEELFMLLYFFNSQCRSMHEAHVERLIKEDYRVGLLIATLFDKYNPEQVELTYQVSTIHALTMLHRFYGLELRDDQKDLLVKGLLNVDLEVETSNLTEVPSLVFCLHLL